MLGLGGLCIFLTAVQGLDVWTPSWTHFTATYFTSKQRRSWSDDHFSLNESDPLSAKQLANVQTAGQTHNSASIAQLRCGSTTPKQTPGLRRRVLGKHESTAGIRCRSQSGRA